MPKGHTNNPEGRPKGSKNERTIQWKKLADAITGECAERFKEELFALEGKEFVQYYIQVLNYFKPKYQSTELKADKDTSIKVVYESKPVSTTSETDTDTEGS